MSDLATQVPFAELLVRAGATALIVVAVATAVGKLGPVAGGLVAGLPIGLGPGFYFLLDAGTSDFLIQTATHSLLALSATQVFLTGYMATARRSRPIISILLAVCIWWGAVWALDTLSATIKTAAILFIAVTVATRWVGRRLQMPGAIAERREGLLMLLVRAVAGGVLVASVTVFAPSLGAEMSGTLLAFPIGYALISLTIHEQFGAAAAVAVVHSALLGTISLATFCVAFAAGLHSLSSINAFLFGLAASVGAAAVMMHAVRLVRLAKMRKIMGP